MKKQDQLVSDGWTYFKSATELGVAPASLVSWRKKFGASPGEPAREIVTKSNGHDAELKQLRIENQRLKILVAEKCLDVQSLQEFCGRK